MGGSCHEPSVWTQLAGMPPAISVAEGSTTPTLYDTAPCHVGHSPYDTPELLVGIIQLGRELRVKQDAQTVRKRAAIVAVTFIAMTGEPFCERDFKCDRNLVEHTPRTFLKVVEPACQRIRACCQRLEPSMATCGVKSVERITRSWRGGE